MEVLMVTKRTMEVFVTYSGKIFDNIDEAIEQDKKERIEELLRKVIGEKYYLMDNEYELLSNSIYDRFESIEEIINE